MAVLISGSKTATGASASEAILGYFNVSISGTFVGTIKLERKLPGQSGFNVVASWTAPVEDIEFEPEDDTLYQFNVTAYSSGTIVYRASQGYNKFMAPRT